MKHVHLDYHFTRELVHSKFVDVYYVHTLDQPVDIFTKGLHGPRVATIRSKLMVTSLPMSLKGAKGSAIKGIAEPEEPNDVVQVKNLYGEG